ncbi:hypothetical protein NMY22_g17394 [Coprinellus aureogranulatus]|nr:hypothetical protein NMY22_g17394 [Coprinellus aureogranulatus]
MGDGGPHLYAVSLRVQLLIPAIESLTRLKWVRWDMSDETAPYGPVLQALARIPNLQNLSFNNDDFKPSKLEFAQFSNLSEITFAQLPLDESVVQDVSRMIAKCPSLRSLLFYVYGNNNAYGQPFYLYDFIRQALELPSFQPSLQSLRLLSGQDMILSPACIPFLRSLSRLELAHGPADDPGLWSGFTDSKIFLRVLRISRLAPAIVQYLTSYEGLEEFVFDHSTVEFNRPCGLTTEDEVHLFYDSILPKHCRSLQTLGVTCDPINDILTVNDRTEWYINEERLNQITACTALKHLEIMFDHFDPGDPTPSLRQKFPLGDLLSTISAKLPRLHEVKMFLDCEPHLHGALPCRSFSGQGWKTPNALADEACVYSLCSTWFKIDTDPTQHLAHEQPWPQFRIKAAWKVLRPCFVFSSPTELWFHLEIEGDDPHDCETRTRACTQCGQRWTSYSVTQSYDWHWESIL